MPRRNLVVLILAALVCWACYHRADRKHFCGTVAQAYRLIGDEYLRPVDREALFQNAMNGLVSGLDENTAYNNPIEHDQLEEELEQQFPGIGIAVQQDDDTQLLIIKRILPNSPAAASALAVDDLIVAVDGDSTKQLGLQGAIERMRGPAGTQVVLRVLHSGQTEPVDLTIVRDQVELESVLGDLRHADGAWSFVLADDNRIGFVRIAQFGDKTPEQLHRALKQIDQHVDGVILDLRNNPGGTLGAAVRVCDMFIQQGVIVRTVGRHGKPVHPPYLASPGSTVVSPQLPMVVLANQYSASASEIVAACLQDHDRAVVVGQRTYGKGTVQNVFELAGGHRGSLRLTTATYWRPSDKNIHRFEDSEEDDDWGVRPDPGFGVPLDDERFKQVFQARADRDDWLPGGDVRQPPSVDDPQLDRAIEFLRKPASAAPAKPAE